MNWERRAVEAEETAKCDRQFLDVADKRLAEAQAEIAKLRDTLKRVVSEIKKYHGDFDARLFVEAERLVND